MFWVLPNGKPAVSIELPKTEMVGVLMKQIRKRTPELHDFATRELTLFRVDLDRSNDGYIEQAQRLAQNPANLEKLNTLSLLETVFTEAPDPRRQKVQILVLPPARESLNPRCCRYWD